MSGAPIISRHISTESVSDTRITTGHCSHVRGPQHQSHDTEKLNKLTKKAGSDPGTAREPLEVVVERRTKRTTLYIPCMTDRQRSETAEWVIPTHKDEPLLSDSAHSALIYTVRALPDLHLFCLFQLNVLSSTVLSIDMYIF